MIINAIKVLGFLQNTDYYRTAFTLMELGQLLVMQIPLFVYVLVKLFKHILWCSLIRNDEAKDVGLYKILTDKEENEDDIDNAQFPL